MESQPIKRRTIEELEKRGAQIEKDPLRFSILYQLSYLNHWKPTEKAN